MTILLLQARNHGDRAKIEERRSFAKKTGLAENQIVPHDLLKGPPALEKIRSHDVLMAGGSGEYYVSKQNLPHFDQLLAVLAEVVEIGHPTFASCFGFQLLVQALGGKIVFEPEKMEVGTHKIRLTKAGSKDSLFRQMPASFNAQLGRKDRALHLPSNAIHLASSEKCPFQALRIIDKPIWATQFHPELSGEENKNRFQRYIDGYGKHLSDDEKEKVLSGFHDSPETDMLLPRFLELVQDWLT
jgi:GMP synthase (glutamine-hydrolysing)